MKKSRRLVVELAAVLLLLLLCQTAFGDDAIVIDADDLWSGVQKSIQDKQDLYDTLKDIDTTNVPDPIEPEYCGNGSCNFILWRCVARCPDEACVSDCKNRSTLENCANCPEDCGCLESEVCDPSNDEYAHGCVPVDDYCGDNCDGGAECQTYQDCAIGQTCYGGKCVWLAYGECESPQDCEVTAPEMLNPRCIGGFCVEGEQYKFSFSPVVGERSMFYSNGKGGEYLLFHAQKMVVGEDTVEWVGAPGLAVRFIMQKGAGGSYSTPLGTITGDEATDEQGMAYATYLAPYIRPTSSDFYTSKAIGVSIMARAEREGDNLGGADYDIELYPPIRITKFAAVPLDIDEKGNGAIEFKVEDFLGVDKSAYFETRHAEASFEKNGPFETSGEKESAGEKFNVYIQPIPGIRSINMDDLAQTSKIKENIKESVKKDMIISLGTGGFPLLKTLLKGGKGKVLVELGKSRQLSKMVMDKGGSAVIKYIKAPGTYFGGYILAEGVAGEAGKIEEEKGGAATGLGGARSGDETAMYSLALAVDGASVFIGIITAPLDFAPGIGQAKDLLVSRALNTTKELALAAANDYRVANAKMRYYPRVIKAKVQDIDGFEVTAWTHFYVRRYE